MLADWWRAILSMPASRLADYRAPLVGLEFVERRFGLDPLPQLGFDPDRLAGPLSADAKFKNLDDATTAILRFRLAAGDETDHVTEWAERLLRYCEIWRHDLKKRALRKWSTPGDARLAMLQVAAFMLDYYEETRDLRFLNVALKLCDMGWVVGIRRISNGIRQRNEDRLVAGLFGVRVLVMRDRALRRLEARRVWG